MVQRLGKIFLKQNFKKRRAEGKKKNWKRALGTARENLILTKKHQGRMKRKKEERQIDQKKYRDRRKANKK